MALRGHGVAAVALAMVAGGCGNVTAKPSDAAAANIDAAGGANPDGARRDASPETDAAAPDATVKYARPAARIGAAAAYDSTRRRVVIFGGFDSNNAALGDTWEWDGIGWRDVTPAAASPPARAGAAGVYDSSSGSVVIFGGAFGNPIQYRADTWAWDGAAWTKMTPSQSPSPRRDPAMAYNSARGEAVLFGGDDSSGSGLSDTWVWDGASWLNEGSGTGPSGRCCAAMAYDAAHQRIVLFGGLDASGKDLGDTWIWNGSSWTQATPNNSPPARALAGMAYDSALQRVVLYGGLASSGSLHDTWEWDGSAWTNATPAGQSPTAADSVAMAYDAATGRVVLFGGELAAKTDETWVFDGQNWTQVTSP